MKRRRPAKRFGQHILGNSFMAVFRIVRTVEDVSRCADGNVINVRRLLVQKASQR